jgi:exosortase A-associated hydrolase 1
MPRGASGVSIEEVACIESQGERLIGILHRPAAAAHGAGPGVVIVVGGPQYRVGSHRQFVLLARALASRGSPVLRFDLAGMGDSGGQFVGFERSAGDIRAAIDRLQQLDGRVREVCLWGLCDAASAALMYVPKDPRVSHLVLVNPWVRTSSGQAQAYLDAYYGRKLRSRGFWRRMAGDPSAVLKAAGGFLSNVRKARRAPGHSAERNGDEAHFLDRMLAGARGFRGRVLLLLSGRDLVATEFELLLERSEEWREALGSPRVITRRLPDATHTFSRGVWRDWVAAATAEFLA